MLHHKLLCLWHGTNPEQIIKFDWIFACKLLRQKIATVFWFILLYSLSLSKKLNMQNTFEVNFELQEWWKKNINW
jgi:hypothetical protein